VVIEDMIILDSKRPDAPAGEVSAPVTTVAQPEIKKSEEKPSEQVNPDDIPF
jgi:hypothetical protein